MDPDGATTVPAGVFGRCSQLPGFHSMATSQYSTNKDLNKAVREFLKQNRDWHFEKGSKHGRLVGPRGQPITVAVTTSDFRSADNFRRDVNRVLRTDGRSVH